MRPLRVAQTLSVAATLLFPAVASAHLSLLSPPSRYGALELKDGPCGRPGGTRSANVMEFDAGERIRIEWDEYVDHDPAHYRISFDVDGDDDFVDPTAYDDFYNDDSVLLDEIPDMEARVQWVEVTLPNVECTNCTLQVMQIMEDKPPFGPPGPADDLYYQCADLILVRTSSGSDGGVDVIDGGDIPRSDSGIAPRNDASTPSSRQLSGKSSGCAVASGRTTAPFVSLICLGVFALFLQRMRRVR